MLCFYVSSLSSSLSFHADDSTYRSFIAEDCSREVNTAKGTESHLAIKGRSPHAEGAFIKKV